MVHILFVIALIGKAVDGLLEIGGGIILLFVRPDQISSLVRLLTQHELSEDPTDLVAGLLRRSVRHLSIDTMHFAVLFLVFHGVIKVGLVAAILRKRLWAYPTAIVAFSLFVAYQFYRYSLTHSVWLIALSVLDVFVVILTWLEFKRLRSEWRCPSGPSRAASERAAPPD